VRSAAEPTPKATGKGGKGEWVSPVLEANIKGIAFSDATTLVGTCWAVAAPVFAIGGDRIGSLKVPMETFLLDAIAATGDGECIFCIGVGRHTSSVFVWKSGAITGKESIAPSYELYHWNGILLRCLASSHDGSRLVFGNSAGQVGIMDTGTGVVRQLSVGNNSVGCVAITSDGRFAAGSSLFDPFLALWQTSSGGALKTWDEGPASSLSFAPGGGQLAIVSRGRLSIVNVTSPGDEMVIPAPKTTFDGAVFAGRHRVIAISRTTGREGSTVAVWDAVSGERVAEIGRARGRLGQLVVSPDGTQVAAASDSRRIHVWAMPRV
jgi:WD40 repeat protein